MGPEPWAQGISRGEGEAVEAELVWGLWPVMLRLALGWRRTTGTGLSLGILAGTEVWAGQGEILGRVSTHWSPEAQNELQVQTHSARGLGALQPCWGLC